jgi:hypothetical protein
MATWDDLQPTIGRLKGYDDSVKWRCTVSGLSIDGAPIDTAYTSNLVNMAMIFASYGEKLSIAADGYGVPIELLAAAIGLIIDEVGPDTGLIEGYRRELPGFVDDVTTPDKVCIGATGITLAYGQAMLDMPGLTAAGLADASLNINACGFETWYFAKTGGTEFDPVFVAAHHNSYAILYSQASRWRMQRFDGDDTAIDRFVNWFNAAVYQQRKTPLSGVNYADSLTGLADVTLPVVTVQQFHTAEAQQAIFALVNVASTASPVLTAAWTVYGPYWDAIVSLARDYAAGLGLPGGASTVNINQQNGTSVAVTGDELTTLYTGLRAYVQAITDYDNGVATDLPTQPVVVA